MSVGAPGGRAPEVADLVIGADLGGTSSRVLVTGADGRPVARAQAGGGNPISHGARAAAAQLAAALTRALRGLDPRAVRAIVVGMAGGVDDPAAARTFIDAIAATGVTATPEFIGDAEVAFCSATPLPSGTVLLAGTGATGARIRDRRLDSVSDGLGWLLGDHGSAFWLGREAVRAAVAALCRTGPATVLADLVPRHLVGEVAADSPTQRRSQIVRAATGGAPIRLAALAPLVTEADAGGDAVAAGICDQAAAHLVATIAAVRAPAETSPLVLSGGVVRSPLSPVGRRVRELAAARFAGEVLAPADGTAGAAWLAVRRVRAGTAEPELAAVHHRLTAESVVPAVTGPARPPTRP